MEEQRKERNSGNTHIQQCNRDKRIGSLVLVLLAVLLFGGIILSGAGTSWSEPAGERGTPPPPPFSAQVIATFKDGKITGVHGNTVEINGTGYELRPDVQIQHPEGAPMEARDIRRGALARFHLKQGRIDMLVVILPE